MRRLFRFTQVLTVVLAPATTITPASVGESGVPGGRLVIAQRAAARTLNPVFGLDEPSKTVIGMIAAPLIRIHPITHAPEGVLAESWKVSADAREISVVLREDLRFSDGKPLTIEDVIFTFEVHLDLKTGSPQRDVLTVGGHPVRVARSGARGVTFTLAQPYAPRERLLGGVAILPKHLVENAYREGRLSSFWNLDAPAESVVGAGPFRLHSRTAEGRILLRRNPHYWRSGSAGHRLPYLDEIEFVPTSGEHAQIAAFRGGEADLIAGITGAGFASLTRARIHPGTQLKDAGSIIHFLFSISTREPAHPLPSETRASGAPSHSQWIGPASRNWFITDAPLPSPGMSLRRGASGPLSSHSSADPFQRLAWCCETAAS